MAAIRKEKEGRRKKSSSADSKSNKAPIDTKEDKEYHVASVSLFVPFRLLAGQVIATHSTYR